MSVRQGDLISSLIERGELPSSDRFRRPDQESIARIIAFGGNNSGTGPRLIFNHRSAANAIWDNKQLQARYRYDAIYPEEGRSGIRIRL